MERRIILMALALPLIMTAGCPDKNANPRARQAELRERVDQYYESFSWREFDRAMYLVVPERRSEFMAFSQPLKRGFTLEDYAIMEILLSPSQERATVVVRRSYVMYPSVTLKTEEITQEWVTRDGEWYLSGPPF